MIDGLKKEYPVAQACRVWEVRRQGYHEWSGRRRHTDHAKQVLIGCVREIHRASDSSYGSRRISTALKSKGHQVGRTRARTLMAEALVVADVPKPPKYPVAGPEALIAPNLLKRAFNVDAPDTAWAGDITYVWTQSGWIYLAVVLDLYSRRIVGWAFSDSPDTDLVTRALRLALGQRRPGADLMFHSDQGCQYTSHAFRHFLGQNAIRQSMSRRGNCWDNAVVERFFRSLKTERIRKKLYPSHSAATLDIADYIAVFYNQQRIHSAANNLPPAEYEAQMAKSA